MDSIRTQPRRRTLRHLEHQVRRAPQQAFCQEGVLERPRYFPGQLMTPEEMILEQNYFRDKMRRHNRLLHGWGVVCGAVVCRAVIPTSNGPARSIRCKPTGCRAQRWKTKAAGNPGK